MLAGRGCSLQAPVQDGSEARDGESHDVGGHAGARCLSCALWSGSGDVPMGSIEPPHLLPPQGSCGPVTQVFCAAVDEKKNPKENPVPIVTEL